MVSYVNVEYLILMPSYLMYQSFDLLQPKFVRNQIKMQRIDKIKSKNTKLNKNEEKNK